ncbi:hypothetical protein B0H13DRAFT_1862102 [Mycena leptocephala]|nr:hypothetical protein B0H13DRAFT_1862102 [Mycena leptocephala]
MIPLGDTSNYPEDLGARSSAILAPFRPLNYQSKLKYVIFTFSAKKDVLELRVTWHIFRRNSPSLSASNSAHMYIYGHRHLCHPDCACSRQHDLAVPSRQFFWSQHPSCIDFFSNAYRSATICFVIHIGNSLIPHAPCGVGLREAQRAPSTLTVRDPPSCKTLLLRLRLTTVRLARNVTTNFAKRGLKFEGHPGSCAIQTGRRRGDIPMKQHYISVVYDGGMGYVLSPFRNFSGRLAANGTLLGQIDI